MVAAVMTWNVLGSDDPTTTPTRFGDLYADVCASAAAAKAGDRDAAERKFVDDAHGPLHQLAAAAEARDRASAARLLEAKQRVEAAVETKAPDLELEDLVSTTRRAVEAADRRDPGACS